MFAMPEPLTSTPSAWLTSVGAAAAGWTATVAAMSAATVATTPPRRSGRPTGARPRVPACRAGVVRRVHWYAEVDRGVAVDDTCLRMRVPLCSWQAETCHLILGTVGGEPTGMGSLVGRPRSRNRGWRFLAPIFTHGQASVPPETKKPRLCVLGLPAGPGVACLLFSP
jgi:hypothetical protein